MDAFRLITMICAALCLTTPSALAEQLASVEGAGSGLVLMAEGETMYGPRGFYDLCARSPEQCPAPLAPTGERAVTMSASMMTTLDRINRTVNAAYVPATDEEAHGVTDLWSHPTETADCEDFVIAKRQALIEAGWPPEALLIGVTLGQEAPYHAVLVVRTNAGELVLDNLRDDVLRWEDTGYSWVARQSKADPRVWVRVIGFERAHLQGVGEI